jgi:hypothetical protein
MTAKSVMTGGLSDDLLVSLSMNYNNSGTTHRELIDNLKSPYHALRFASLRFTAYFCPHQHQHQHQ